ncbi:MAG TPA: serine hydrolase [Solirubrobacteraceae bacterium]|nr:serine hydrolase [Solirubrobacteraceae bacterium]
MNPRASGDCARGEQGFVAVGLLLGAAGTVVGVVMALAVVIAVVAPGGDDGCAVLDDGGEPVGPTVGSLGGVGGSGISRGELRMVRASGQTGSTLTTGAFRSTAYGPPWGGIQGPGVATAGGIRIDGGAPRKYMIASDPRVISLGQWVYVWPNPFGWRGAFLSADTGGRIKGRVIDFYDWRGRAYQNRWNQQTTVSDGPAPLDDSQFDGGIPISSGGRVDGSAAQRLAGQLTGQPVGFALVDDSGHVLGAASPNATNRSASITKAMILIAVTQHARARALTAQERELAAAMIRRSDNQAANALFARVGAHAVAAVARRAAMTRFELVRRKQAAGGFILGSSRVSAVDQARLFVRIERLTAARHRAFAMRQLENVEGAGRFGVLNAGLNAQLRSKGGWRPEEDGGWTVNQAAQITIGEQSYGFAVVLGAQQTFETGAAQIAAVARAAFSTADASLPPDCAGGPPLPSETGERIGQIARRQLGRNARRQSFAAFAPPTTQLAWCAWFSTNVWRMAGVPIRVDWFSGHHYAWAKENRTLFKDLGAPPRGATPPIGSALMYGSGPRDPGTSRHVNLVDTVNPDGTFMITGGNQDTSRVTRQGPCRMTRSHPARLRGEGCDPRPIYAIAAPTPAT